MHRPAARLAASALLLGAALSTHDASADKPASPARFKKTPAPLMVQLPAGTMDRLSSSDPAAIKAALDDVRTAGKAAQGAAPAIAALLQRGLPADVTLAAIDTLGDVEAETASAAIAWYALHRSPRIRQAAVKALARTKGKEAVSALRHALSDEDPGVRGLAATGLGALKAYDTVKDLFVALDHGVGEAAVSIGQLCTAAECDDFASRLGKLPFDVMTGGFDQVLFRPSTEIDDDEKVKTVGRVRELGTAEANKFLKDVQSRWPKTGSARVKTALDQGVLATGGGSQ